MSKDGKSLQSKKMDKNNEILKDKLVIAVIKKEETLRNLAQINV